LAEAGISTVTGMHSPHRQRIADLSLRDFCLFRAICLELEALDESIQLQGELGNDGITPEIEQQLLSHALD
jgi:hypothetical protein